MAAAFLLRLAYFGWLSPLRLVLMLTAYGALLELGQLWVPGRNGQIIGIMADFFGASIGVLLAETVVQLFPKAIVAKG
jgi:VanZ family protein